MGDSWERQLAVPLAARDHGGNPSSGRFSSSRYEMSITRTGIGRVQRGADFRTQDSRCPFDPHAHSRRTGSLILAPCPEKSTLLSRNPSWKVSPARKIGMGSARYEKSGLAQLSIALIASIPRSAPRDATRPPCPVSTWLITTFRTTWGHPSGLPSVTRLILRYAGNVRVRTSITTRVRVVYTPESIVQPSFYLDEAKSPPRLLVH